MDRGWLFRHTRKSACGNWGHHLMLNLVAFVSVRFFHSDFAWHKLILASGPQGEFSKGNTNELLSRRQMVPNDCGSAFDAVVYAGDRWGLEPGAMI